MNRQHPLVRRIAALLIPASTLLALAACSREDKILNPPVGATVTYANTIQHLIADRSEGTVPTGCTSCHHANTNIPNWSDYDTIVANAASIRGRLTTVGDTMRGFLRTGEPEIIVAWIDAGMPR